MKSKKLECNDRTQSTGGDKAWETRKGNLSMSFSQHLRHPMNCLHKERKRNKYRTRKSRKRDWEVRLRERTRVCFHFIHFIPRFSFLFLPFLFVGEKNPESQAEKIERKQRSRPTIQRTRAVLAGGLYSCFLLYYEERARGMQASILSLDFSWEPSLVFISTVLDRTDAAHNPDSTTGAGSDLCSSFHMKSGLVPPLLLSFLHLLLQLVLLDIQEFFHQSFTRLRCRRHVLYTRLPAVEQT